MDETSQQSTEGDLGLITKDCDGNGSIKDSFDTTADSRICRKNSGEAEVFDTTVAAETNSSSSNGIDSEVKPVVDNFVSYDSKLNSEVETSSTELIHSNTVQSDTSQGSEVDHENDIMNPAVKDSNNEENSITLVEGAEQLKCSDLNTVKDNDECADNILDVNDQKIENAFVDVDKSDENIELSDPTSTCGSALGNDNENSERSDNMPYEKKDVCSDDVEMSDLPIKNENVNVESEPDVSAVLKNDEEQFESVEKFENKDACTENLEEPKKQEDLNDTNESSEFLMSVDPESKDNLQFDSNPLSDQHSERDEEMSLSKNDSEITDTSGAKDDCAADVEPINVVCTANSPKSIGIGQCDESQILKTSSQNEKNELVSTEIVNCNDESQMDLNEKDLEVNNIDTDPCEGLDKKDDKNEIEEMDVDKGEESFEKEVEKKTGDDVMKDTLVVEDVSEKEIVSVDESEALVHPGGSEEETITGDTNNEGPINDSRGKDAEICIIPDDVTPRLPVSSHDEKQVNEQKNAEEPSKVDKAQQETGLQLENEKDLEKSEDDCSTKSRAVKTAAKVAESKTKSLAQKDDGSDSASPKRAAEDESTAEEAVTTCVQCGEVKTAKSELIQGGRTNQLCSEQCYNCYMKGSQSDVADVISGEYKRKCSQCHGQITADENTLSWETMDFCNEECLGKYQTDLGSRCANCKGSVPSASLGKYCVRFGFDIKQFCTSSCLEEFKKGLKVCSYCQKDISTGTEGFLAPVGHKGHFKDFCTQSCMEKYEQMGSNVPPPTVVAECAVCSNSKPVKVEVQLKDKVQKLCSEPCFAAFKFVNNISEGQCDMCKKYFDRLKSGSIAIYAEDSPHVFCGKTCMNVYILANRKIVACNWCKVKKYKFDLIRKVSVTGQVLMMCSLNCLTLYQASVNAVTTRRIRCDFCMNFAQPKYHLTMSDATVRNFCDYACVMSFQNQYPKQPIPLPGSERLNSPIPMGGPKKILPRRSQVNTGAVPVISSVQSLASPNGPVCPTRVSIPASEVGQVPQVTSISQPITIQSPIPSVPTPPAPQVYQQIITKPAPAKQQKNKAILCKPYSHTKGVSCRPHPCIKQTQTDESLTRKFLIPVPVPIYVPAPMHMFAAPFPVPMPFPLPVPVPIFIPTTRNSAKGIMKEIKKIQEKIPTDPFEAELLMMAEMVAGEKKQDPTDSESEDGNDGDDGGDGSFSPENVDASNAFGEDMLQIALKMATEMDTPAVDMESVLTSSTITPTTQPTVDPNKGLYDDPDQVQVMPMNRGRKRSMRGGRNSSGGSQSKRGRRISGSNVDVPIMPPPEPVPPPRIEVEKPDANMCLKYTFGVNAWRHWVMQKNAELEKAAMTNRKIKLFKPELLQLTADELNFSLCLFVKEVRKPNGAEYAPDTIYYLCLGIQQYLFENGRIDNIFTDSYYEKFTDCLDEVAKKFAALYNDSQYIVTRVEEEHLWESKQLGAHSPHVLLSTLMFFNTKHFNLVTVEEHMQLSFSHIMKHWKRNPNAPGVAKVPGSRNVLLRFYPPQSALEANSRKKKVYEQQENEENPLRCPVKLYEFYLSKCPESVKTRNDVFYLLPERSCVPDSPVWYSTMALGKEPLTKMLHRVKMVKEINIALLSC
ncbi:UNVERIFIED_CONTAM: hypothetical protein PYX00_003289 [Menopon gallinae]|uniref:TRASH domain-containing protein n=1 Tax=Menopon gallinae TaxID=328185 RepID=A0AAW2I108_9NEOP